VRADGRRGSRLVPSCRAPRVRREDGR
jgi:hypothetical protein